MNEIAGTKQAEKQGKPAKARTKASAAKNYQKFRDG